MKIKNKLLSLVILLAAAASLHALTPDEWQNRQSFKIERAGPIKFSLPPATQDAAQPDLRDLRIIDASGKEIPYLLLTPVAPVGNKIAPKVFRTELTDKATILFIETGTAQPLDFIELETGATSFIKPVRIDLSTDGENWNYFDSNLPVFRQDGATKTTIPLGQKIAPHVRLTINDEQSRPIAITGAYLQVSNTTPSPTEPFTPRIVRTEEFTGETVITLDLGAANLSLASLEISTEDTLFARNVTVAVQEIHNDQISERPLARGTIFQIALDLNSDVSGLQIPVDASIPSREVLVHIRNDDSPSLRIREIQARRTPLHVVIAPNAPGRFELLTGNTQTTPPHYDLAALATELGQLQTSPVLISEPTKNASYRQTDPLADLTLEGAVLDISPWKHQRVVHPTRPGVQQIELDLHALANTRSDFADIRLMQSGKQVPFIIERTGHSRDLIFSPVEAPDPKRPSVSRWKFPLSQAGLPLSQLVIHSPTKLFDRSLSLFEVLKNHLGDTYQRNVSTQVWMRKPAENSQPLIIALSERMQSDSLWIETDNGNNPPLKLQRLQAFFPVVRLLFKATHTEPFDLVYGNPAATAPRYDVSLIANQLLNAKRVPALLGSVQTIVPTTSPLKGASGGVLLWAVLAIVLAIVVVLLLVLVAKLLPKPTGKP